MKGCTLFRVQMQPIANFPSIFPATFSEWSVRRQMGLIVDIGTYGRFRKIKVLYLKTKFCRGTGKWLRFHTLLSVSLSWWKHWHRWTNWLWGRASSCSHRCKEKKGVICSRLFYINYFVSLLFGCMECIQAWLIIYLFKFICCPPWNSSEWLRTNLNSPFKLDLKLWK